MRRFSFFLPLSIVLLVNCLTRQAEAKDADLVIESDLVKILDSFDSPKKGHDPNAVPKWSNLFEAKGTLVFFDNSNSSGKKPSIQNKSGTSSGKNALKNILQKARNRLLGKKASNEKEEMPPVFSESMKSQSADLFFDVPTENTPSPRLMKINYDGPKTLAFIPPNTAVEIPFLKHIPYFFSRIEVLGNGSIKVTETIQRVVEPNENDFKGIDRYFPKYYKDRTGKKHRTHLSVIGASVNDTPIQPKIYPDLKGIRVALHSKSLPPGTHQYQVTYLFSNKITELKNSDENADISDFNELIWEVTGTNWDIPITRAAAILLLPKQSKIHSQAAVTGGAQGFGHNYRIKKDKTNDLSFVLSFPLAPYEGLSILANWSAPDNVAMFKNGKLDKFIIDHGTMFVSLVSFLFILSYYLVTWLSQKKNQIKEPAKASPLQKGNLTPAVLKYALKKEVSSDSLFVILLEMAAKKFLSFGEDGNGALIIIKETDNESGLTPIEKQVASKLFTKDNTFFALTHANSLRLTRIMTDLEKPLKKEYRKKFTVFPHTYFCFGILMALIAVISLASMSLFPTITALTSLACVIMLIPTAFVGEKIYMTIRADSWRKNKLRLFKLSLLFLPLLIILTALFIYYSIQTTATTAFFFFALLACIGIFKTQLRAPSSFGTSILDNIEGYKLYLSSQDNTLLSTMRNATSKIKALYGKHLPFAVALDLEQLWTRRFIAFSEEENQLKPDWYKGKLPFTEDFIKSLFIEFNAAFPKKDTKGNRKKSSRFKKDASNIDDKKNTHV